MEWWVDFEIETGQHGHDVEDCLALQEKLGDRSTVGNTLDGLLSVSLEVEAFDVAQAVALASTRATEVVTSHGWRCTITAVDACPLDKLEGRVEEPNYPDLVSGPEAAEILGVNRQRLHQLATTHRDFPAPLYRLGTGSLWLRSAIEAFDARWTRTPGRPRKSA